MKRLVLLVMALWLAALPCLAEEATTRTVTLMKEGTEETVTETLATMPDAFSFWYNAEVFTATVEEEDPTIYDLLPVSGLENTLLMLSAFTVTDEDYDPEAGLSAAMDSMTQNGFTDVTTLEPPIMEGGWETLACSGETERLTAQYYLVSLEDVYVAVSLICPTEALEGLGVDMLRVVTSLFPA